MLVLVFVGKDVFCQFGGVSQSHTKTLTKEFECMLGPGLVLPQGEHSELGTVEAFQPRLDEERIWQCAFCFLA